VIARHGVLPPRHDWVIAAVGVAIPIITLLTVEFSNVAAAALAVLLSGGWLWLVRRDLVELGQTLLAPLRSRRGSST